MAAEPARDRTDVPSKPARGFYQRVLRAMVRHGVPCLVGGTYALEKYTGIRRATKDLDLFLERRHWDDAVRALAEVGIPTCLPFPHWLGKAGDRRHFVDLVFASGNGLCRVDEDWFAHAPETHLWGVKARVCPPEELLWTKAFVMERERFDGGDVLHLMRAKGDRLDWRRLLDRFGEHWEVLLAHLVLFGYAFPADRDRVPRFVMHRLLDMERGLRPRAGPSVCRGTLLSREQYLVDVEDGGDVDARLAPAGSLSPEELRQWTAEIPAARRAVLNRSPRRRRQAS